MYSFGVVLVELVTGRKAVDINRPKGQQFLTEWVENRLKGQQSISNMMTEKKGHLMSDYIIADSKYA